MILSLIGNAEREPAETPQVVLKAVESVLDGSAADKLKKWMADNMQNVEDLAYSKKAQGFRRFLLDAKQLPEKSLWPKLTELLCAEGFASAQASENGIQLGIGIAA